MIANGILNDIYCLMLQDVREKLEDSLPGTGRGRNPNDELLVKLLFLLPLCMLLFCYYRSLLQVGQENTLVRSLLPLVIMNELKSSSQTISFLCRRWNSLALFMGIPCAIMSDFFFSKLDVMEPTHIALSLLILPLMSTSRSISQCPLFLYWISRFFISWKIRFQISLFISQSQNCQ